MSFKRLLARVPSAQFRAIAVLKGHKLKFHKRGKDGSAKCDITETKDPNHKVIGVLYEINEAEKSVLDRIEGLHNGYEEKMVHVETKDGKQYCTMTYYATNIDPSLKPFHWYKGHVLQGAAENNFPKEYMLFLESFGSVDDHDEERHQNEMSIYREE